MQRGDISIDMQGNALMELLRRCEIDPLALGQIRRVAPGVLRPLFELGIETLDDIILDGKDIISAKGLKLRYGSAVKKRHLLALNCTSLLLSRKYGTGEDPSKYSKTGNLDQDQRRITNSHLFADAPGAIAPNYTDKTWRILKETTRRSKQGLGSGPARNAI